MLEKLKKAGIVVTIAVLLTIFIFSLTSAIYPRPDYGDFCNESVQIAKPLDREKCGEIMPQAVDCRGPVDYTYDDEGCPIEASCNPCWKDFDLKSERYNLILFIVSSITGVVAILFGLFYRKKDDFWTLLKGGFVLGGLISLFIGTGVYYDDMGRFVRPAVILAELLIVVLVTYRLIKKK